ncbi:MAG TPA: type IV toxin-antitoxin system AbiEi family antitoxin domain-containing protein [Pseudonocardiaceae bacterium]|nr:type IV toxin-antitoxin system AbiEi family antitoxin domain-containing protein [Pseudonocardiaceae bacterium]
MSLRAEAALAGVAAGQWGLFTATQAQQVGVTRVQLTRLVQAGVIERRNHGVYLISGAGGDELLELRAAWLNLDPARSAADRFFDGPAGAVISHASAAALMGFGDLDADRHEFTLPARKQTRRNDVVLHRAQLAPAEVTIRGGLPVTRPERTILDLLAAGHDGEHVAGVLGGAVRARAIDVHEVARRAGPFAAKYGCPPGDGDRLVDLLLSLGSALEHAIADWMAKQLRTTGDVPDVPFTQLDIVYPNAQIVVRLDPDLHHKESAAERERSRSNAE